MNDFESLIYHQNFKRLLLAVSGGLDSICLAHYFVKNKEMLGIEWLGIAHVHHGLREGTADRDAAFVESFAKSHGVPFFLKMLDGTALKAAEGSLEETARDARYKALVEIALNNEKEMPGHPRQARTGAGHDSLHSPSLKGSEATDPIPHSPIAIVTAHHAGDQSETMYMRLRRGTTLAGLRGIQEVRTIQEERRSRNSVRDDTEEGRSQHPTVFIFRPFLNITRAELREYAQKYQLHWCEDESNTDVKFARNKIRHEFLPNLERECPGATKQLCRIAGIADRAYAKVMEKCESIFAPCLLSENDSAHSPSPKGSKATDPIPHNTIALDKKKLNRILQAHKDANLSEMLRLWLSEKGFRFPVGFFDAPKEPAHIKVPVRAVYRKRSILKIRHTVWICEFKDTESAAKFVS